MNYVHPNDRIDHVVASDIKAINAAMAEFGISAGTRRDGSDALVSPWSEISYMLTMGKGQTIDQIERRLSDITEFISRSRGKYTPVLLDYAPLSVRLPHPNPKPLRWDVGQIRQLPPHTMALGRSFSHAGGSRLETISFDESPHILVAGTTGAGKSVLMQSMFASLCASTPPDQLQIVVVDLKNSDMSIFADWPHVARYCWSQGDALDAIVQVTAERERRIADPTRNPYRLVLWIDEMLEIASDKDAADMLSLMASGGRAKSVNLICATTAPTAGGGVASVMKKNFPTRLVGKVAPGESQHATNRAKLHADLLQGKGSFLRIDHEVRRFQSFLITEGDIGRAGQELGPRAAHRLDPLPEAPAAEPEENAGSGVSEVVEAIRPVWAEQGSLAAMIRAAYGEHANTGGSNRRNVLRAVEVLEAEAAQPVEERKIIKMWG